MRLILFMTWDISLALWKEKGLLQREIKLYQALAQKGVDVTFFSWGGGEDREIAKTLLPEIKVVPIYDYIPFSKFKVLRAVYSLIAPFALRKYIRQADILKTNQIWGGWVAVIASILFRKPLIARCGFELYDFTCRQKHGALRRSFIWFISRVTYGMSNHICVASKEDKDFIIKNFGQKSKKISIHPNWIDTDFFSPQNIEKKENHILFVGRLSEQKNLPMLIDALKGSDFILDIVGCGELKQDLENLAKNNNVKVNFLGLLPNDELPNIYNSYPVFVLPSYYEGNPKTLLEAMACGVAVIGTDVSGISSVIKHEQNGLLSNLNPSDLRDAIDRLMADNTLRIKLGGAARKQITDNQTLDKLVSKELACYKIIRNEI